MGPPPHAPAGCCALALGALLLLPSPAGAATESDIPPECGTRAAFDAQLKQRLGDDAPLDSIVVTLRPAARGYHLRVQIGSELRELEDESCSELFRAAVVVAVAILLHEPESAPPVRQPPPEPAPPERAEAPQERPRFTLAAGAGVTLGTLPPPVLTLELESKVLWRDGGIALQLRYLAPGEKRDDAGRGVRLQALGAGLSGIFRPSHSWEARLGVSADRLFGSGLSEQVATFQSQKGGVWAAGPTLGLCFVPLEKPPFWLGLGAEGRLDLLRGRFAIRNYSGEIYQVPSMSGSVFVRLGLIW